MKKLKGRIYICWIFYPEKVKDATISFLVGLIVFAACGRTVGWW
jgi:hypothetical protein